MILQRSLKLRLTFFFSIMTMLVITVLNVFISEAIEEHFKKEARSLLKNKIILIEKLINDTDFNNNFSTIIKDIEQHDGLILKVISNKKTLYSSSHVSFPDSQFGNANFANQRLLKGQYNQNNYSGVNFDQNFAEDNLVRWPDHENNYAGMKFNVVLENTSQPPLTVILAANINSNFNFFNGLKEVLLEFTLIAGIAIAILSWFVTCRGLRPLQTLTKQAALVSMQGTQQRMPVDNLPCEIAGLSLTLNNMLERLERAFERLSNFSSDIAHELRTPINNLMMQTQVSLAKSRDTHEYRAILGSNYEEFERLARMIADMLFLAKSENELIVLSTEEICLEQEIADLFEFYDALAEEKNITLSLQGEATVTGDKLMLRRAFSNLLSNAIRHSFADSTIMMSISSSNERITVDVLNNGETIDPDHLIHLFERFYRADKSRAYCSQERVGLGMAITQSIAKAHGGKVQVSSEAGQTVFAFSLNETP
ncbi:MAG: two-component system heavy metal sensor histidine kinase CusS [Psychromonas sp.]|jgi:two-component system heavy metal sensor histidine kinase CusS